MTNTVKIDVLNNGKEVHFKADGNPDLEIELIDIEILVINIPQDGMIRKLTFNNEESENVLAKSQDDKQV